MNDNFTKAKIKLTLWYLSIIMLVSISFSFFIYEGFTVIARRAIERHNNRIERYLPPQYDPRRIPFMDDDPNLENMDDDLIGFLISFNIVILISSGIFGYVLAGKTLEPIKLAVDEQKRFFSDAAHELKTPLTSLKTEIEVNLRDKNLSLDEAKHILKSNLEEVNRLQELSESLLYEGKYQADQKHLLKFEHIDLEKIVEDSIKGLKAKAEVKKIKINKDLTPIKFTGETGSLRKLVTILIDNAIKYTNKEKEIWIKLYSENKKIILEVADEGVGIKSSDIPYIFNRFYQANNSRNKNCTEGFGLGLSIAKNIVQMYNGKISVVSTLGKGSSFKVILPIN